MENLVGNTCDHTDFSENCEPASKFDERTILPSRELYNLVSLKSQVNCRDGMLLLLNTVDSVQIANGDCLSLNMEEVTVDHNKTAVVVRLEESCAEFASDVTCFSLVDRGLTNVPVQLMNCVLIRELNLSNNLLSVLPLDFGGLVNLEELDVSSNLFSVLPNCLSKLGKLKRLNASRNKISEISNILYYSRELEVINLSRNELVRFPPSIGTLKKLRTLDLSWNKLCDVGHLEWACGETVADVNLSGNNLFSLPKWFMRLSSLTTLNLSHNKISTFEDGSFIAGGVIIPTWPSLKELDIHHCGQMSLPISVFKLRIQKLFSGNECSLSSLSSRSGSSSETSHYMYMGFYSNEYFAIPKEISSLKDYLVELNLSEGSLERLPDSFCDLVNLETLDLHANRIFWLPNQFGMLVKLKHCNLSQNRLATLPESFVNLPNLDVLLLDSNQLSELPENFENLTSLTTLRLDNNKFTRDYAKMLLRLPKLTKVSIDNNDFVHEEFVQQLNGDKPERLEILLGSNLDEFDKDLSNWLKHFARFYKTCDTLPNKADDSSQSDDDYDDVPLPDYSDDEEHDRADADSSPVPLPNSVHNDEDECWDIVPEDDFTSFDPTAATFSSAGQPPFYPRPTDNSFCPADQHTRKVQVPGSAHGSQEVDGQFDDDADL